MQVKSRLAQALRALLEGMVLTMPAWVASDSIVALFKSLGRRPLVGYGDIVSWFTIGTSVLAILAFLAVLWGLGAGLLLAIPRKTKPSRIESLAAPAIALVASIALDARSGTLGSEARFSYVLLLVLWAIPLARLRLRGDKASKS